MVNHTEGMHRINLLYLAFLGFLLLLLSSSSLGLGGRFGNLGSGVSDRFFGTTLHFFHFLSYYLLPRPLFGRCIGYLDFGDWYGCRRISSQECTYEEPVRMIDW